jgi:hypothetical protein
MGMSFRLALVFGDLVKDAVFDDGRKISGKTGRVDGSSFFPEDEEGLLDYFFGCGRVVEAFVSLCEERFPMTLIELGEGFGVGVLPDLFP